MKTMLVPLACLFFASQSIAQGTDVPVEDWSVAGLMQRQVTLPVNAPVEVTPAEEITSNQMKEGSKRQFFVARDVAEQGVVVIPRGAPVTAEVTWRTGRGIAGKSAKFELTFRSVQVGGLERPLRGRHRQEGGGTASGVPFGATIFAGRPAIMLPGQIVTVFTNEPITVSPQ